MSEDFTTKVLRVFCINDAHEDLFWNFCPDLQFFVRCNDIFWWACGDVEPVETDEDLKLLQQCFDDAEFYGPELYASRRRGLRPQGAFYRQMDAETAALFDAAGPYREVGLGNPYDNIPGQ